MAKSVLGEKIARVDRSRQALKRLQEAIKTLDENGYRVTFKMRIDKRQEPTDYIPTYYFLETYSSPVDWFMIHDAMKQEARNLYQTLFAQKASDIMVLFEDELPLI